jgi:hypothetical protein
MAHWAGGPQSPDPYLSLAHPRRSQEAICELRRRHGRFGPRRLVFEMKRRGHGRMTRSTVYQTLVRNGLIVPKSRHRTREDAGGWERPVAMQLWQLNVTASAFLADGTEVKIGTWVDDHSRRQFRAGRGHRSGPGEQGLDLAIVVLRLSGAGLAWCCAGYFRRRPVSPGRCERSRGESLL